MGEIKLDIKDRKILYELDLNSRQSYSQIAKHIGLSKEQVNYRIKKLENEGIIDGYYTLIDLQSLGYLWVKFFIKFTGIDNPELKTMVDFCVHHQKVGWVVLTEGSWDIAVTAYSRNIGELKEMWMDINSRFGTFIKNTRILFSASLIHLYNKYLFETNNPDTIVIGSTKLKEIDDLDFKILKVISSDARIPNIKLAKKVSTPPQSVAYRLHQLQKKGVIKAFRANFNLQKLGHMHYKILLYFNNFNPKEYSRIISYLKNHRNVVIIIDNLSEAMLDIEVVFSDPKGLYDFLSDIKEKFSQFIKYHESAYTYSFEKIQYFPERR